MPQRSYTRPMTAEHLASLDCPICDGERVLFEEPIPVTGDREDQRIGYMIPMRCLDKGHEFSIMLAPMGKAGKTWVTMTWNEAEADA